ncbi:MAG: TetR/AcrR family transcriptional regulator [Myxococcales bacterium]|nr:TetR/AcrR family transcriptional regulator [Myxococcales bacterium]
MATKKKTRSSSGESKSRDDRWAQLVEAAREVFGRKGYHAATVDDITRAAGVAKGTFYLYFAEKPAVFYELIEQFFEMVANIGAEVARDVNTRRDYYERVEDAARKLAQLFRENRDLVRLVYRESMGMDERLEQMVRTFYRQLAAVEADNVRLGVELGLFRDDIDPALVAYAHIGMVERVLLESLFDRDFPKLPDLVAQIVELAYSGLRRRDERPEEKKRVG